MNYNKAQKEIFSKILSGQRRQPRWFTIDENNIFVTPNGFMGFVFPVSTVAFNLDKIEKMSPIPITKVVEQKNELVLTNDLRLSKSGMIRRLKKDKCSVFVDTRYLGYFQNPKFFQDITERRSPIVVTEFSRALGDVPVGLICPVAAREVEFGYYGDGGFDDGSEAEK